MAILNIWYRFYQANSKSLIMCQPIGNENLVDLEKGLQNNIWFTMGHLELDERTMRELSSSEGHLVINPIYRRFIFVLMNRQNENDHQNWKPVKIQQQSSGQRHFSVQLWETNINWIFFENIVYTSWLHNTYLLQQQHKCTSIFIHVS